MKSTGLITLEVVVRLTAMSWFRMRSMSAQHSTASTVPLCSPKSWALFSVVLLPFLICTGWGWAGHIPLMTAPTSHSPEGIQFLLSPPFLCSAAVNTCAVHCRYLVEGTNMPCSTHAAGTAQPAFHSCYLIHTAEVITLTVVDSQLSGWSSRNLLSSAIHFSQLLFWGESAEADSENAGNNARRACREEAFLEVGVMLCVSRGRIARQQGQNRPGSGEQSDSITDSVLAVSVRHCQHAGEICLFVLLICAEGWGGGGWWVFFMGKAYLGNPKAMCRLLVLCRVFIWVCRCKISSTFACHFMHLFSLQFLKQWHCALYFEC